MSTVAIEKFLQTAYSDEKLAALLAHAEDGKLSYNSCCCFIGVTTSNHGLMCENRLYCDPQSHYWAARKAATFTRYSHFTDEEYEYRLLADTDTERRAKLLPLIRAEIARRDALKEAYCPCGDTCPTCDPESALEAQQQAEECSDMDVFHRY